MTKIFFMQVLKYVILLTSSFLAMLNLCAQQPTATEIQTYLRNNIKVFYLSDPNTNNPDFREIKATTIDAAVNNIIFGKINNNRMDLSAQMLMALLSAKSTEAQFQKTVYEYLQKLKRPVTVTFVNDIIVKMDKQYLPRYGLYVFEWNNRASIWPASYPSQSSPSIVMGEYLSRSLLQIKEIFLGLLSKMSAGVYGASDTKKPNERISYMVRYDLPKLTQAQLDLWNWADKNQLGVLANDYDGKDEIGTAPVEREMKLGVGSPQFLNFWYPNTRPKDNKKAFKQTMIGRVKGSEHYENDWVFPDYDVDFYIEPSPAYQFLIAESPKPNASFLTKIDAYRHLKSPECPPVFDEVEAEIDLKDIHNKQFPAYFNEDMKTSLYAGFYGTWMYDRGHCDHPEIHPAEQIWWRSVKENVTTLRLNLICDYSDRYNKVSQFDTDDGLTVMRPWAEAPLNGVFAIPFKVKPGSEKAIFRIIQHDSYNVNSNNSVLFNKARINHFVFNGQKIVSVIEPESKCMNITFDNVGLNTSGEIQGFVVITTSVGKNTNNNNQEAGHLFLEVKKSQVNLSRPATPPGKIKVTLESIECSAVDDDGDVEEIYGLITTKAFAISDTVGFALERLPFTSNMGSAQCASGEENLFCLPCPKWLLFEKGRISTFGGAITYNFPAEGFLEINGDLDESDSQNCKDFDYLGTPQKKIIMTSEIGMQQYKFTQFFASGKTMMKAHYIVQRVL